MEPHAACSCFGVNGKLVIFILLSLCLHVCLSDTNVRNSLMTVEDAEDESETEAVVENEDEHDLQDMEVFYPTREWQVVKPGQAVPPGLHMRLNLQTGRNEAKLPDGHHDTDNQRPAPQSSSFSEAYTKKELKEALAKFKEGHNLKSEQADVEEVKRRFRPIEDLKKEFRELNLNIETDFDIMTKIINRFNNSVSTTAEKVNALYDLEYYVHQVDNAQNLHRLGGLQLIISSLNSTEPSLIEHSAFVIGSALASNPKVQIKAFEGGVLQKLLAVLATEQPVSVKKKALYALSSLLRQFPYAQQQFLKLGGLQVLKNFFKEKNTEPLFVRVITLLYDMIMEKILLQKESNIELAREKKHQYDQINVTEAITEQGWCKIISNLLSLPENDAREKVLKMLSVLTASCKDEFLEDRSLHDLLDLLRNEFEEFVEEEEKSEETDGYFRELVGLVNEISDKLK
ncbi:nucleotide exchange factor SIL1 [Spea bombifrons]|uniref:nucleotide exchange factor SIL1 n=1 Tax=Spea bombifrons TaxID=233779 RepID=UPI00234915C9|nr:nucleotide exchange factor SIL1 [Spea bombifrons]XP_053318606.1 nucleotide exchange factor SIL1 [Spea bombifrons]